jgi:DNA-binding FadR family transcriptional regulator
MKGSIPRAAGVSPAAEVQALRGGPLFESMLGISPGKRKASCRIANAIEEKLIQGQLRPGEVLGSEAALASEYGVCRVVLREAARILEARGIARMRRGPKGGLVICQPERPHVLELALRFVAFKNLSVADVDLADLVLSHIREDLLADEQARGSEIATEISAIIELFSALAEHARMAVADPVAHSHTDQSYIHPSGKVLYTRAPQIAYRLMRDAASASGRTRLGSEFDLCERYSTDRSVLRQAIRILESDGVAVSQAGRGNGLLLKDPPSAPVCRLIHCLFSSGAVSPDASLIVFKHLSARMASIAANQSDELHRMRMFQSLQELHDASEDAYLDAIYAAEESQFGIVANPILQLMLGTTRSYPSWRMDKQGAVWLKRGKFLKYTKEVMEAIRSNRSELATQNQYGKFTALHRIKAV